MAPMFFLVAYLTIVGVLFGGALRFSNKSLYSLLLLMLAIAILPERSQQVQIVLSAFGTTEEQSRWIVIGSFVIFLPLGILLGRRIFRNGM